MSKTITLSVKGAPDMNAYLSIPWGIGPFPALILFQEAYGVNNHMRKLADRLAAEGYLVVAPELFHRTAQAGYEAPYGDFDAVKPHFNAPTTEQIVQDTQAVYDWLSAQDNVRKNKIGSIGFCLGGRAAFIANSAVPLAASVSFYGGGMHTVAEELAGKLHAPQLLFWAGRDQHIKPEHVASVTEALKVAGKDHINVEISYADHAYFNDERPSYHSQASLESWGLTKAFLKNKLQH